MLHHHDDAEYDVQIDRRVCPFHEKNPGKSYAGCTCSTGYGMVRVPAAEYARRVAERERAREDEILAEAERIKARRGVA